MGKCTFSGQRLLAKGLRELRAAVAEYLDRTQGLPRFGEAVPVGPGSKELMFLLQVVYYRNPVIPRPSQGMVKNFTLRDSSYLLKDVSSITVQSSRYCRRFQQRFNFFEQDRWFDGFFDKCLNRHEIVADVGFRESKGYVTALIDCA